MKKLIGRCLFLFNFVFLITMMKLERDSNFYFGHIFAKESLSDSSYEPWKSLDTFVRLFRRYLLYEWYLVYWEARCIDHFLWSRKDCHPILKSRIFKDKLTDLFFTFRRSAEYADSLCSHSESEQNANVSPSTLSSFTWTLVDFSDFSCGLSNRWFITTMNSNLLFQLKADNLIILFMICQFPSWRWTDAVTAVERLNTRQHSSHVVNFGISIIFSVHFVDVVYKKTRNSRRSVKPLCAVTVIWMWCFVLVVWLPSKINSSRWKVTTGIRPAFVALCKPYYHPCKKIDVVSPWRVLS